MNLVDDIRRRAEARKRQQISEARTNCGKFIEYVLRDEQTNSIIHNAPHHLEWHELLDKHPLVSLSAPIEHGKTYQLGLGRVLFEIGKDPTLRIALISNTITQAQKLLVVIRQQIETNPRLHEVFPHLKRSTRPGAMWHSTALTVERETLSRDPSIQALGHESKILGSRLDLIIGDDILDFANTRTQEQIEKIIGWFESTVYSRLTENGRCWLIGTPWTPTDMLATMGARTGWVRKIYSAVLNFTDPPEHWVQLWPEQWPMPRLIQRYRSTTAIDFGRSFLCQVRTDQSSRFQQAWIDAALAAGRGRNLVTRAPIAPSGNPYPCFTGVDLAVGKSEKSDLSSIFTIGLEGNRKVVLDVQAGRWQAPDILQRIHLVHQRFNSIIYVEDNASQSFLLQWATDRGLPVRGFTTNARNKYDEHFGVESLAIEMRAGLWVIPSGQSGQDPDAEVKAWIQEMLFYSPDSHTGDRLMASWFAREAARQWAAPMRTTLDTQRR